MRHDFLSLATANLSARKALRRQLAARIEHERDLRSDWVKSSEALTRSYDNLAKSAYTVRDIGDFVRRQFRPRRGDFYKRASSIIAAALSEYCRDHAIAPTSDEYEQVLELMHIFYHQGNRTVPALKAALRAAIRRKL